MGRDQGLGVNRVDRSLELAILVTNRGPVSGRADPVMIRPRHRPGLAARSRVRPP